MSTTTSTPKMHEGKVDSVHGDTLNTTCNKGNKHVHTIAKDAKVTCDGQASKAKDLKTGTCVHVTTHPEDKSVATAIESGKNIKTMATAKA